jgi:CheY-like chemotaxis protein
MVDRWKLSIASCPMQRSTHIKPRVAVLHQPVVLLAEDEALFRMMEVEVLREAGFWVLEAQDADEAFECLKKRDDIKVVLTDVAMPGSLDGFEFARLVAQGWPEVGVLVISGRRPPKDGELPPTAMFVPKPISPTALVEKVRSMVRPVAGADQYAAVARRPHRHAGGRLKGLFRGALRDGNVPVGRSADQIESPDQSTLAGGRGSLEADDPRTR